MNIKHASIIGLVIYILPIVLLVICLNQSIKLWRQYNTTSHLKTLFKAFLERLLDVRQFVQDIPDMTLTQLIG